MCVVSRFPIDIEDYSKSSTRMMSFIRVGVVGEILIALSMLITVSYMSSYEV